MKKILLLIVALVTGIVSFAASPNLQSITLTNGNGETLEFYANQYNKVIYHAPGSSVSRGGTFYLGSTINSYNGNTEAGFSIEIPVGSDMKTLSGTIYYRNSDGHVFNVTLNGSRYQSSSGRTVAPRRRR